MTFSYKNTVCVNIALWVALSSSYALLAPSLIPEADPEGAKGTRAPVRFYTP